MKSKKTNHTSEWKVENIEPTPLFTADLRGSDIAALLADAYSRIQALERQMSTQQAGALREIAA